ncbi:GNAT family N-acetyltransferase [Pseudomonas soli]|uniref:GNAT family N-acetyltransferase n=1 Tax=Pseudomonas soli TaxID=1306993 RepID=UPI003820AA87
MTLPVELLQTGPEHADLVRNLYQFYAYESSDWEQEDVEADGRFYLHEPHFTRYWQTPGWSASLILVDGFIAGFLLIERSELPGIDAWELADLFVLKKYRRQGVGLAVARRTLCEGQGDWLVRCYGEDAPALAFCQAVLADLPRPVREIALDDEPSLRNFLVTQRLH